MKRALMTGITGQDGSYLAEFLLRKGYQVHGTKRRSSSLNTGRIDHLYQDPHCSNRSLFLHYCDLTDSNSVTSIVQKVQLTNLEREWPPAGCRRKYALLDSAAVSPSANL